MNMNPKWKELLLDAYSMRAALAVAVIVLMPDIAYLVLGFDVVSPYVRGWFTLIAVAGVLLGRVMQQGIEDGTRVVPAGLAWRRTWQLVGGALLLSGVMVLLSVGSWLLALLTGTGR